MNIRDIAQLANVTPGTVSKVLNNYPDISDSTRQLVLRIIEENQYQPSNYSRTSKASDMPPVIGLFVEGVTNNLYNIYEDMLSIRLHNGNYTIMSYHDNYFSQEKSEKFQELIAYTNLHKLDGIIYIGGNFSDISQEAFQQITCPLIFVNTVLPSTMENTNYSSVQVSNFDTAYKQMNYLINKGHTQICTLISSVLDTSVYGLRVDAYRLALSSKHLEHNLQNIVEGDYTYQRSYDNLVKFLHEHNEITAICCVADIVCVAAIRAILAVGKIPGKDIEIISFDGIEETNYLNPSVTTYVQPVKDVVITTFDLLIGLMKNERTPQQITFQPTLKINESCQ